MAFPVAPVKLPAALDGTTNGAIPAAKLRTVPSLHDGRAVTLLIVVSRAFVAMRAAAEKAGVRLEAISSYRTYEQQVALFTERYVPHYARHTDGTVSYRIWNGVRWYHAFGPTTAVPGTSNHGRALAIDFVVTATWQTWMLANAARFGWSWEIQSEAWHLRYVAGDQLPPAVLAYESSQNPPSEEDDMPKQMLCRVGAKTAAVLVVSPGRDSVHWCRKPAALKGHQIDLALSGASTKVTRLDPASSDANIAALAAMVLSLPFYGPMPPAHAALHTGPHYPGEVPS